MATESQSLWQMAIGPLIGSFFGITFGLFLNKYFQYKKSMENRFFYLNTLRNEINFAIDSLRDNPKDLIPEDTFKSIAYNIRPPSFSAEEMYDIGRISFIIQAYNFEAEKLRDNVDNQNFNVGDRIAQNKGEVKHATFDNPYIVYLGKRHTDKVSRGTIKELQKIKYKDWVKNDNQFSFWRMCINELLSILPK